MPLAHREIFTQMEEFRLHLDMEERTADDRRLPRIPPATSEIRTALYSQLEHDELLMFQHLDTVDARNSRTKLTRHVAKEVNLQLQHDRDAQITLARVHGATRSKYVHIGHLLKVKCP